MDAVAQGRRQDGSQVDPDLLDPCVVSELLDTVEPERLLAFSDTVRAGCREAIAELRLAAGSVEETVTVAHRLKGLVGNLGLRKLSEIAAELEQSQAWSDGARLAAADALEARLEPSLAAFRERVCR